MSGVSNSFKTCYTPDTAILLFDRFNSVFRIIAIGFRVCSVRYVWFDDNDSSTYDMFSILLSFLAVIFSFSTPPHRLWLLNSAPKWHSKSKVSLTVTTSITPLNKTAERGGNRIQPTESPHSPHE